MKKLILASLLILVSFNSIASDWSYSQSIDDFTDERNISAEIVKGGDGISMQCVKGNMATLVMFSDFIGINDRADVIIRVDKNKAIELNNVNKVDGYVIIGFEENKKLINQMKKGKNIKIKISAYSDTVLSFNLDGFNDSIKEFKLNCHK